MVDNMCPEHQLNEERFERIEKTLDKLNKAIDSTNINLSLDIKELSEDFSKLKEDYIATKNSVFTTVKKLDAVPEAINNLEKTLIQVSNNLSNNANKTELLHEKFIVLEKRVDDNEEKSKFDIWKFIQSLIPSLLTGGIIYALMRFVG